MKRPRQLTSGEAVFDSLKLGLRQLFILGEKENNQFILGLHPKAIMACK
jgi:hypothetical protein